MRRRRRAGSPRWSAAGQESLSRRGSRTDGLSLPTPLPICHAALRGRSIASTGGGWEALGSVLALGTGTSRRPVAHEAWMLLENPRVLAVDVQESPTANFPACTSFYPVVMCARAPAGAQRLTRQPHHGLREFPHRLPLPPSDTRVRYIKHITTGRARRPSWSRVDP